MRVLIKIALVAGFLTLWLFAAKDRTVVNLTNLSGTEMVAAMSAASKAHQERVLVINTIFGIVGSLIVLFYIVRAFKRSKRAKELHLDAVRGVKEKTKIDHEYHSACGAVVLFDDTNRTMNFVRDGSVHSVSYGKFSEIEWQSQTKGKYERWDYLAFKFNDPHNPLIKLRASGKQSAEFWYAKIQAIVNS